MLVIIVIFRELIELHMLLSYTLFSAVFESNVKEGFRVACLLYVRRSS